MKINEILECINKTLDEERALKEIHCSGHFVAHTLWEKKIGTAKEFHVCIDYINNGVPYKYSAIHHTCQCPVEDIDNMKEQVELMALTQFFKALRLSVGNSSYEGVLKGDFKGWN